MENKENTGSFSLNGFPEVKMFLLSALEELSNRALQYDEASRLAIQALTGKSLRIESQLPLTGKHFDFVILFCDTGLIFSAEDLTGFDAEVKANNFINVARFFSGKFDYGNSKGETQGLIIQGDLDLVNHLQDILSELDIDWEEPLSEITGDVVAHEIGRFANDAGEWVKSAGEFFEEELDGRLNTLSKFFFKKGSPGHTRKYDRHHGVSAGERKNVRQEIEAISEMQGHAEQVIDDLEKRLNKNGP